MARWTARRTSAALVVPTTLALLAPTAAVAEPTETEDPVEAAAGWLANQLVDDERVEVTFDFGDGPQTFADQGLTADVVVALAGAGVASGQIAAATDWLEAQTGAYTGTDEDEVYAGSVAKLLLVAEVTGRDTTFDGQDLVALLEDREQDDGRFTDESDFGDFSSTITQSLAVLALHRTDDATPSDTAVSYLADQACDDGGFPQDLDVATDACEGQVDATAFAVQALLAVGEDAVAATAADWLVDEQDDTGGFLGAEATANANSTGLAAVALAAAGEDAAAEQARDFLWELQTQDCALGAGSIRYDAADGGDPVRATAQALPGLTGVGWAEASSDGASVDVPTFACPTFPDVDETNVHADAISELTRRGLVGGFADGTFGPAADVTRGQLAAIMARAADLDPVDAEEFDGEPFDDVESHTHEGVIYALAETGVISGFEDGTFGPDLPVRRDQAASLLARWLALDPVDDDAFTDIEDNVHREQINALAQAGIALGTDDDRYLPARSIRRDQTASLVLRSLRVHEQTDATGTAR